MISKPGLATVIALPKRAARLHALIDTPRHAAPCKRETYAARNHNFGVGKPLLFHQRIEPRGIGGLEPHTAVRRGAADPAGVEVAVDRVSLWAEEDGMRHR